MDVSSDSAGAKYGSRNVLADADIRDGIKGFTQWPTIPQVRRKCCSLVGSTKDELH